MFFKKVTMIKEDKALKGRDTPIPTASHHFVTGVSLHPPFEDHLCQVQFGMGCFWGVERLFWGVEGVKVTAVGYSGGYTPNPTYQEVCTGETGHNETVLVVFDPDIVSFETLLKIFWEGHDPSQGMRQGNDIGTQYRSGIYTYRDDHLVEALRSRDTFNVEMKQAGYSEVTTEIIAAKPFYYAEDYHQQYLAKNPGGYCGLGGTGVCYRPTDPQLAQLFAQFLQDMT